MLRPITGARWNAGGSPYTTMTFSGDAHIMQNKLADGNVLGLGLAVVNDKTLALSMTMI